MKVKTAMSRIFRRIKETEKANKKYPKRKIMGEEIKDIQKRRSFLTATIEDPVKNADKYVFNAAKKKKFQLIEWPSDLWLKQKKIS